MSVRAKKPNKLYFKCDTLSLFHVLGKKWTVDVIEILNHNKELSFNAILRMLRGATPRALSNILSDLSAAQVVKKTEPKKSGAMRASYVLTSKGKLFEKFIRSGKQLGVDLYSIDAGCVDRECSNCR